MRRTSFVDLSSFFFLFPHQKRTIVYWWRSFGNDQTSEAMKLDMPIDFPHCLCTKNNRNLSLFCRIAYRKDTTANKFKIRVMSFWDDIQSLFLRFISCACITKVSPNITSFRDFTRISHQFASKQTSNKAHYTAIISSCVICVTYVGLMPLPCGGVSLLSQLENKHNFKWKWLFDLDMCEVWVLQGTFVIQIVKLITLYCWSWLDVIMRGFIIKRSGL